MISNDTGYWATGITVKHHNGKWTASVTFHDNGFANDDPDAGRISTEGTLHTRYYIADGEQVDGLTAAIDAVKADAERLGIIWRTPTVYMDQDGEGSDDSAGWRSLVDSQAERLGWAPSYATLTA
jgi:hypothetical protein